MSKVINKVQRDLLLHYMQENPDIAHSYSKANKEKTAALWKEIDRKLNNAGPPVKSVAEWKKVWLDQKKYVRQKAALCHQSGGPNIELRFSATEEAIYKLMSTKEADESVESGRSFDISQSIGSKKNDSDIDEMIENLEAETMSTSLPCSNVAQKRIMHNNTSLGEVAQVRKKPKTTDELVEKKLEMQSQLCEKIGEMQRSIYQNNAETQSSLKKICRSLDRISDNESLILKELKRHHYELEKLRIEELKIKVENRRLKIDNMQAFLRKKRPLYNEVEQALGNNMPENSRTSALSTKSDTAEESTSSEENESPLPTLDENITENVNANSTITMLSKSSDTVVESTSNEVSPLCDEFAPSIKLEFEASDGVSVNETPTDAMDSIDAAAEPAMAVQALTQTRTRLVEGDHQKLERDFEFEEKKLQVKREMLQLQKEMFQFEKDKHYEKMRLKTKAIENNEKLRLMGFKTNN